MCQSPCGDKVPQDKKDDLKEKVKELRDVLAQDNATAEQIQTKLTTMEQAVMECSKVLYQSGSSSSEEPPKQ